MREADTDIGGGGRGFPATRHSAVLALRSPDPEVREPALARVIQGYWKPAYKYLRIKWNCSNEEAKDLTQDFFARALEKDTFERYEAQRGRFRTFVRTCLDNFVLNQRQADRRQKRGGDRLTLSLDFGAAETEVCHASRPGGDGDHERYFEREWARGIFGSAVERMQGELSKTDREPLLRVFERYDLCAEAATRPTYADLARELGLTTTQVTNHLAAARRAFRRIVLDELHAVTGSEEEFRAEARELLGVEPP